MMWERVERARSESDTSFFFELLYIGEFTLKLTCASLLSAVETDREGNRYRLAHELIRADGIGTWARAIDDMLMGPATQYLSDGAKPFRRMFTERVGPGSWQFEAVTKLHKALECHDTATPALPSKIQLRAWFSFFCELRNKTRGHGAPTSSACAKTAVDLEQSVRLICDNNPFFELDWAYLHQNLSGKYRVVSLGGNIGKFARFGTAEARLIDRIPAGVYIDIGGIRPVEFLHTNLDLSDFLMPNGSFNGRKYELHSLISDSRIDGDAAPYLQPSGDHPHSETHGTDQLEIIGNTWTNLPSPPGDYVRRPKLEMEITELISNDRHPIVTLVGRGGIGKTSLALRALHNVAAAGRFDTILWFSARDIDLLTSGPKIVKPQVITDKDIANQFCELMGQDKAGLQGVTPREFLAANMFRSAFGGAILFVFDNFETVDSPVDLFAWIDTNIRLPNKVLITSRFRDFRGDYPISIIGMEQAEARELIERMAGILGIADLSKINQDQIIEESDGHPYVIRIVLGEMADAKRFSKPERIIARKDEILDALFERTFANLTPLASRLFLTLCGWRSLVPQLALEAVVLRGAEEPLDPAASVDELVRMSLVQRVTAIDKADFLETPLAAALFGHRKLAVSPLRSIIEGDLALLRELGPTDRRSVKSGLRPHVDGLFRRIAAQIYDGKMAFATVKPVLEFIAGSYPPAWMLLSELREELGDAGHIEEAAAYTRRYLEQNRDQSDTYEAWDRLANLYRASGDVVGACGAMVRAFDLPSVPLSVISDAANWLNNEHDQIAAMSEIDKTSIFGALAGTMEYRSNEASSNDLSRLAWLHLHAGNIQRAFQVASDGLQQDGFNVHCQRLVDRLSPQQH